MRNDDMRRLIAGLHKEIDVLLEQRSREAYIGLLELLERTWEQLFSKDIGLQCICMFADIWRMEVVKGEHTILEDVTSVEEAIQKYRTLRFALLRLANDLPVELCIEGMQYISDVQLSSTALNYLLPLTVEDEAKVLANIERISREYTS